MRGIKVKLGKKIVTCTNRARFQFRKGRLHAAEAGTAIMCIFLTHTHRQTFYLAG